MEMITHFVLDKFLKGRVLVTGYNDVMLLIFLHVLLTQKQNSQMPVHPWQRGKISTPTGASNHQTIVVSPTITSKDQLNQGCAITITRRPGLLIFASQGFRL